MEDIDFRLGVVGKEWGGNGSEERLLVIYLPPQ